MLLFLLFIVLPLIIGISMLIVMYWKFIIWLTNNFLRLFKRNKEEREY